MQAGFSASQQEYEPSRALYDLARIVSDRDLVSAEVAWHKDEADLRALQIAAQQE